MKIEKYIHCEAINFYSNNFRKYENNPKQIDGKYKSMALAINETSENSNDEAEYKV